MENDRQRTYDLESTILTDQVQVSGIEDLARAAVSARWRAAGWPLPGEPGYHPSIAEVFYSKLEAERTR